MTPQEQERIKADAEALSGYNENRGDGGLVNKGRYYGYIAGATAENSRAQVLVDALEAIKRTLNWIENADELDIIRKALEQWKAKKEVEDEGK